MCWICGKNVAEQNVDAHCLERVGGWTSGDATDREGRVGVGVAGFGCERLGSAVPELQEGSW